MIAKAIISVIIMTRPRLVAVVAAAGGDGLVGRGRSVPFWEEREENYFKDQFNTEVKRIGFKLTWRGTGKEIYFRYCQLKRLGSWKDFENIFDLEFWFLLNLHSEKNKIKIEDRYNANCNESF